MSTIAFEAMCNRGHRAKYAYPARTLREHLERGTLMLSCARCHDTRPPTPAETLMLTQMVICSEAREEAATR
jgi:hypothetical protein